MAFGDSTKKTQREDSPRVSPFLKLDGERIVRILDEDVVPYYQYWLDVNIGGRQVGRGIVAGFNNPIKDFMDSIGEEDPRYRRPSRRFAINVLDKTLVKIKTDGTVVYADERGNFPTDADLSGIAPAPHDQVKIVNFGPTLMDQLKTLNDRARSRSTYEPITIQQFDVRIISSGRGRDKKTMAMQDADYALPQVLLDLPRYDLNKIYAPLPNEALQRILNGDDYNEIIKELYSSEFPMVSNELF